MAERVREVTRQSVWACVLMPWREQGHQGKGRECLLVDPPHEWFCVVIVLSMHLSLKGKTGLVEIRMQLC